jgi:hypothetical protein
MSRVEVAGDICLRRPRPTQGCSAEVEEKNNNVVSRSRAELVVTLSKRRKRFKKCHIQDAFRFAIRSEN